jgi:hypothetical protein
VRPDTSADEVESINVIHRLAAVDVTVTVAS